MEQETLNDPKQNNSRMDIQSSIQKEHPLHLPSQDIIPKINPKKRQ